jgi:hypothetical protein
VATKTERDYLAAARKKVSRPQESTPDLKYLIYGRNKKGKTRFALSGGIDRTLVLDPEKGTDTMMQLNPWRWPVTRWQDMQDAWGAIRTGKLSPKLLTGKGPDEPFSVISVDGTTKMNNMALRYIMSVQEQRDLDRKPGIIDRRDYNKSGELMKDMMNNFLNLRGFTVVFTAQERMITADSGDNEEDDESTFFVPDLPNGVRAALNSIVDCIGRLYVVHVEVKGETKVQRRLQIGIHERYDTGFRSDHGDKIPEFIRYPTLPKLEKLLLTGSVK